MPQPRKYIVMTAKDDTGAGTAVFSGDFKDVQFDILTDNSFSGTIKFYRSNQDTIPDVTAAVSATNQYSVVESIDLDDETQYTGTTGLVITTDAMTAVAVNSDRQKWTIAAITAISAGDATVTALVSDNR